MKPWTCFQMFPQATVFVLVLGQITLTHPNTTHSIRLCACRGEMIQSLGKQARDCAQNLTMKARKALGKWPAILKDGGVTAAAF